jgi:tRNA(Ile)-lysidine synthase
MTGGPWGRVGTAYHEWMDPVISALDRAAETTLLPPGRTVLLAVSGGADSMALLCGAAEVMAAQGWRLAVGHVHHGWRGREADRDLAFVRDHARRLSLPFFFRHRDARGEALDLKLSPEAGARHARYSALREIADEAAMDRIATAHQRDDRVESYLLARERRAGLSGLAGPRREREDGVVRPLLEVSRREILEFLDRRGIAHRRDASNGDLRLARNRIRREVARLVARRGEAALRKLEGDLERFSRERDAMESEFARQVLPRIFRGPGAVAADASYLESCGQALQRLAIERMAVPFALPGRPPLTGREREQILVRLRRGSDFRFEAGRRIRFDRKGSVLRVHPVPARRREDAPRSNNPGKRSVMLVSGSVVPKESFR